MAKIFPQLIETINSQIQIAKQMPSTRNMKKTTSKHTLYSYCSSPSIKKNILKAAREKSHVICRGTKIRETVVSYRKQCSGNNRGQHREAQGEGGGRLLAQNSKPAKNQLKNRSEIQTFSEIQKQREFSRSRPVLSGMSLRHKENDTAWKHGWIKRNEGTGNGEYMVK